MSRKFSAAQDYATPALLGVPSKDLQHLPELVEFLTYCHHQLPCRRRQSPMVFINSDHLSHHLSVLTMTVMCYRMMRHRDQRTESPKTCGSDFMDAVHGLEESSPSPSSKLPEKHDPQQNAWTRTLCIKHGSFALNNRKLDSEGRCQAKIQRFGCGQLEKCRKWVNAKSQKGNE